MPMPDQVRASTKAGVCLVHPEKMGELPSLQPVHSPDRPNMKSSLSQRSRSLSLYFSRALPTD